MESLLIILIPVLVTMESRGNPHAIGDDGEAVGILQIHEIMVDDVNRIVGCELFKYSDRVNPEKCYNMARVYFGHYSKNLKGSKVDILVAMARQWNGGPKGHKKKATREYGEKARFLIEAF